MAAIGRKTRRYPTDLTDEEWSQVEPLLPKAGKTGRRRRIDLREVLNAVRYLARTGCGWRMLPVNFSPWQTVYWWFRRFVRQFLVIGRAPALRAIGPLQRRHQTGPEDLEVHQAGQLHQGIPGLRQTSIPLIQIEEPWLTHAPRREHKPKEA